MVKVNGTENPAGILTHPVEHETLIKHLYAMDMERREDIHVLSPMVATGEGANGRVDDIKER